MEQNNHYIKINPETTGNYLASGGSLQKLSPFFEERPSQVQLTIDICKTFNSNGIAAFEAGTGVGKSFAYLLPSIIWAQNNNHRVVISTGTINLQQQLIEKDIPFAKKILNTDIKATLIKGRQNYICKRRLYEAVNEPDLFDDENEQLIKIEQWVKNSDTGSKNDLPFMPNESIWQRINSESDACMGNKCFYNNSCFVMKVKKQASESKILVVNHHLLFADIEARMYGMGYDDTAVLPPYKRLVFDEAHGIENAATSFFSETITKFKLAKQLNMFYRQKKGAEAGHLFTLEALSSQGNLINEILSQISIIKLSMQDLDSVALVLLENEYTFRLTVSTEPLFNNIFVAMDKLKNIIENFTGNVRMIIEGIPEKDRENPEVWECKQMLRRIENIGILCKKFVSWSEYPDTVFWLEKNKFSSTFSKKFGETFFVKFIQTPLEIASKMNIGVFEPMDSVICTSATLRTGNSFDFWSSRSGLFYTDKERVFTGVYDSPFPYKTNVKLCIANDAPAPNSYGFQDFLEMSVPKLINAANGRTLVLFTSYDSLKKTWEVSLNSSLCKGIKLLKQGDDDRFRLLESFKIDESSVLFATDSFWEGIDVPGESLSHVIIAKLPFHVPSDPVFAARCEDIERRGGNPFMELSIPDAVIKFRQGFGRLMRRASDKGIVTVLDKRIYANSYGKIFISSIPDVNVFVCSINQCVEEIKKDL
ncbi:MAG: helicase [Treponema sp.]|nr:helicase [Treponema sp.]